MDQSYSDWRLTKKISVTNLFLDPLNPRIPNSSPGLSQDELIAHLVKHDKVYKLAKSIEAKGYLPTETLVAVKLDIGDGEKRQYVLEGNRRLAALKVILSPESAPMEYRKKFKKIADNISLEKIRKIFVIVAPSRDDAIPLLLDRHTHTQVEKWTRPMQANYTRHLFDSGYTEKQIAAKSGKTVGEVISVLRADALYKAACSLDLDDETNEKVKNPNNFNLSTLERLFNYKPFRTKFGIEFDDSLLIVGKVKKAEFEKGFKRVVSDIANENQTSRTLLDKRGINNYLDNKLGSDRPDTTQIGKFKIYDFIKSDKKKVAAQPLKAVKKNRKATSKSVIPFDLKVSDVTKVDRVRKVFVELKGLDLYKYENASALLLRTLLDLCVSNYLEKSGNSEDLLKKNQEKGKPKDFGPRLSDSLFHLLENVDIGLQGNSLSALKRFRNDKKETLCLDTLDKYVHNQYSPPTATDLRSLWTTLDPLMRIILADPPVKGDD